MENADKSTEHFSFYPEEQLKRIKEARASERQLLACYHSRPASAVCMSDEDIRLACDWEILYVIYSVINGELKAYRINSAGMPDKLEREVIV